MWKILMKDVDLGEPTSFLDHVSFGLHSTRMSNKQRYCGQLQKYVRIHDLCRNKRKVTLFRKTWRKHSSWSLMIWNALQRNAWKDVANWRTQQLNCFSKSQHHALTTTNSRKKKCDLLESSQRFSHNLCKNACAWPALVDVIFYGLWTNLLVLSWTRACDKRSARLISYIHHTCEFKQYCHVGNTAQQCRLGSSQNSDFAGDLEDSKSTSGELLCIFGSHTSCQ